MRKLILVAAMLMASASAHAGGYSFNVQGHNVRISVPRNCASLSCISVAAPTITDKLKGEEPASAPASPAAAAAPATATTAPAAPAPETIAPAPIVTAAAPPASKVTVLPPPASETYSTSATALVAPEPVITAPVQKPSVVAVAAPTAAPAKVATTPHGVWMSEKKEGKIRIEDCDGNLCGYAVDANTGANGARVLINMKPKGEKWAGRIHDTRNGGTYDSTIAMRGNDTLKVQGCALGGLFCGGETWTRIE